MSEPDPQPPQPRPVSIWRWLLMLAPSVPMLLSPLIAEARPHLPPGIASEEWIGLLGGTFLTCFLVSAVFSIILGLLLEKWRHGTIGKISRAISYGVQILAINFVIAFAGCTVGAIGTMATHP